MNYFIGWKFGVLIKIVNRYNPSQNKESRLIGENTCGFYAIDLSTLHSSFYAKNTFSYEPIPFAAGMRSPRYPVCVNEEYVAFCNSGESMVTLSYGPANAFARIPEKATLTIDGKTIELSRETIDTLKKELGV